MRPGPCSSPSRDASPTSSLAWGCLVRRMMASAHRTHGCSVLRRPTGLGEQVPAGDRRQLAAAARAKSLTNLLNLQGRECRVAAQVAALPAGPPEKAVRRQHRREDPDTPRAFIGHGISSGMRVMHRESRAKPAGSVKRPDNFARRCCCAAQLLHCLMLTHIYRWPTSIWSGDSCGGIAAAHALCAQYALLAVASSLYGRPQDAQRGAETGSAAIGMPSCSFRPGGSADVSGARNCLWRPPAEAWSHQRCMRHWRRHW